MDSTAARSKFSVSSAAGGYKTPSTDSSGRAWYQKGYTSRASEFGVPLVSPHSNANTVIGVKDAKDMCGAKSEENYWHFLFVAGVTAPMLPLTLSQSPTQGHKTEAYR